MKKKLSIFLVAILSLSIVGCKDNKNRLQKNNENLREYSVTKTIADFQYGVANPYDKYTKTVEEGWTSCISRTFESYSPQYSYTPNASSETLSYYANCDCNTLENENNCNYYTIYPASKKTEGIVSARLKFYIEPLQEEGTKMDYAGYPADYTNYLDLSNYENLGFIFSSESNKNNNVEFKVFLKNHNGNEYEVLSYKGKGEKQCFNIDLTKIDKLKRNKLEYISVVNNVNLDSDERILNKWYKIEAGTNIFFNTVNSSVCGLSFKSEYLGNMLYTICGAYSATGFYDKEDKLYKVWFGAGVPETQSTDNIYYMCSVDPERNWSKPIRITTDGKTNYRLIDNSGKLRGSSDPIGYGGDPSVVKVNGKYYMYFSAIEWNLNDGKYLHWNKIWLATSTDGITWNCEGAVVDTSTGGLLGYGSGAPSVVYYNNKFYLYYYSQSPDYRFPKEKDGLVLKISNDGINFGEAISIDTTMSSLDVKYIPSLLKWVGTYYSEKDQFGKNTNAGVRLAVSEDGIHWMFDHSNASLIAQDMGMAINHNSGFIGTEYGYADTTLYCMYGANDLPLTVDGYWFSSAQYDSRQLEYTKIIIN